LHELQRQRLDRDDLLMKLGAAKKDAGNAARLVRVIDFCDGGVFPIIGGFGLDRNSSPAAVPGSVPV
jgi:hypothetical protein